jgi:hypothetical protein
MSGVGLTGYLRVRKADQPGKQSFCGARLMFRNFVLWLSLLLIARPAFSWQEIDGSPSLARIAAGKTYLFGAEPNGNIWLFNSGQWLQLDNNPNTVSIYGKGELYQRHRNGSLFKWTGSACYGDRCTAWERIDGNPATVAAIPDGGGKVYQLHKSGALWEYTGQPCQSKRCPGWRKLDHNRGTERVVAASSGLYNIPSLYQMHRDGKVWVYTGSPCQGKRCAGWELIDNNRDSSRLVAGGDKLFQIHRNGTIWEFTGRSCQGDSCEGWRKLDGPSPDHMQVVGNARGDKLYKLIHGRVWELRL